MWEMRRGRDNGVAVRKSRLGVGGGEKRLFYMKAIGR
jgi:hypothetical protein